jgi:hypothetical protein
MKSEESKKQHDDLDLSADPLLIPIKKFGIVVGITKIEFTKPDNDLMVEYDADGVQMREDKIDKAELDAEVERIMLEALSREAGE